MSLKEAESFFSRTVSKTRYEAKNRRGLDFNINTNYILHLYAKQNGKCALTGYDLEFTRGGSFGGNDTNPYAATMDRIDNDLGYIPGNIQLTCWMPNRVKGSLSNDEFVKLCRAVADTVK